MSEQTETPDTALAVGRLCDHRCLKDDGHVERGELHFHGYTIPSDRDVIERLTAENERLRALRDAAAAYFDNPMYVTVNPVLAALDACRGRVTDNPKVALSDRRF